MIDPELAALMVQTVRLYAPGAIDAYGHSQFSATPTVLNCHISGPSAMRGGSDMREVATRTGSYQVPSGMCLFPDVYPWLTDAYRLEVPDQSSATGYRTADILSVYTLYDENGPHHMALYFGMSK